MNKYTGILFLLFSFIFNFCSIAQQQVNTELTRILFIFDASNSMNGPWQGSSRIEIARRVMINMLDSLKKLDNLELALRIYGHQTPLRPGQQDCNDTKLEVPFSPGNHDKLKNWIKYVIPKGTTPIARSLEKAGDDFPDCKTCRNIIILITDGIEACDEDPCAIARALIPKGIVVRPFVIGVGLNAEYLKALECIGTVYDATSEESFVSILNLVVSEAVNNTTAQINLNDIYKKPTETNISYTLYDQKTGAVKHNYVHTFNKNKLPDTLVLDPLITYKLVVHSVPKVEKMDIKITPGKHNIIEADCPQGFLDLKINGAFRYDYKIKAIIRESGNMQTLNVQDLNAQHKYLVGKYDIEILTLPRIYINEVEIKQSQSTKIEIPLPGVLDFYTYQTGYGAIFVYEKGEMIWVCNLSEETKNQKIYLQPGKYKIVYRNKKADRTFHTTEKLIEINSGKTTVLTL